MTEMQALFPLAAVLTTELIALVILAGVIAIIAVIIRQLGAPDYILKILWILLAIVVAVVSIRFLTGL